jgi:arylsulfatase A-like enzyme
VLGWLDNPRSASAARVFLATATATIAAMWLVKAASIAAVVRTDFGSRALNTELGIGNALGWLAADVWAALLWAALMAAIAGAPRSRWGRRIGAAALALAGVALAAALVIALIVYDLFGTAPTTQLLASLDHTDDAGASIAALIGGERIALGVGLAALLAAAPLALARVMARWPRTAAASAGFVGLAIIAALAGEVTGEPSRFELDRNPITAFAGSALAGPPQADAARVAPSELSEVLRPIAAPPPHVNRRVDRDAYRALADLGRRRPNVVLVMMESTALDHMTLHRPELDTTPFLASLARRSLLWPWHHAHTPKSIFAIVQILCSALTEVHAATPTQTRPRIDCRSASELLSAAGYRAGLFHSGHFRFSSKDLFLGDRGFDALVDAHAMPDRADYFRWSWGIEERASIDAMLEWARANRESPLFVTYIPIYPHHPYHVPDSFRGKGVVKSAKNAANYRRALRYFDGELEALVRGFESAGLGRDTLFVITGDHGEGFGEHPGSKAHGGKLYGEQTRTFTLWYAPGLFDEPRVDDRPFGHIDLLPTLLDVLGLPGEPIHRGLSAFTPGRRPMVPLYTSGGVRLTGFVDGRMKYIYNARSKTGELFDLDADPGERIDLSSSLPGLARLYRSRAERFKRAARDAWRSLPELAEDRPAPTSSADLLWSVDPALGCGWPPGTFHVEAGVITPTRQSSVDCDGEPLGDTAIEITGIEVDGIERRAAAWIEVIVGWIGPGGERRQIAYCKMNGNEDKVVDGCEPERVPGQVRFPGGGRFFAELKFYMLGHDPRPESFALHRVAVRYRPAAGPR